MQSQFRIVYFVRDHLDGERVMLGALVAENGATSYVDSGREPCLACVGHLTAAAIWLIRQALRDADRFDRLPSATGPHAIIGPRLDVPPGISGSARDWVLEHVVARRKGAALDLPGLLAWARVGRAALALGEACAASKLSPGPENATAMDEAQAELEDAVRDARGR